MKLTPSRKIVSEIQRCLAEPEKTVLTIITIEKMNTQAYKDTQKTIKTCQTFGPHRLLVKLHIY